MSGRALVDSSDEADLRLRPSRGWSRTLAVIAVASVGLVAGCAAFSRPRRGSLVLTGAPEDEVTGLRAKLGSNKFCETYPYLKFEKKRHPVIHSNLCYKGPDKDGGSEGMVYKTIAVGKGAGEELNREVYLVVNGSGHYKPFASRLNGMQGFYGSINMKSGSKVDLRFHFYDRKEFDAHGGHAPKLKMQDLALTFFDLDQGRHGTSKEYVEIGGFKEYHLTDDTEVKASDGSEGRTRFSASTYGDGEDNPTNPEFLTHQQKNRAVTLLFKDVTTVPLEMGAGRGVGPRFFTFVARPSLLCAVTVQENFKPPLPDLDYREPMEKPIKVHRGEKFQSFPGTAVGKEVNVGDPLFLTTDEDGQQRTYTAPIKGKVTAIQSGLKPNDDVNLRLDDKAVVVIEREHFKPLPQSDDNRGGGPGKEGEDKLSPNTQFIKYTKKVRDTISKDETFAKAKEPDGSIVDLKSVEDGVVAARQEDLRKGDYIVMVDDMNLITVGPYPALPTNQGTFRAATVDQKGLTFQEYKVKAGEVMEEGDVVAVAKDKDGNEVPIKATKGGIITATLDLKRGAALDRVEDGNLATVGQFAPLPKTATQTATEFTQANDPPGTVNLDELKFVRYHVAKDEIVEDNTLIATLKDEAGKEHKVEAKQPGMVVALQSGLKEGMRVNKVMQDKNLATIGRLPILDVNSAERGVFAPVQRGWLFKEYVVQPGENVNEGDVVYTLMNSQGQIKNVTAPKSGTVTEIHDELRQGDDPAKVTKDNDLVTVGKFAEPPLGFREVGAEAEMDDVFDFYIAEKGKRVHFGDPIAQVTRGVRRLKQADGTERRLGGESVKIPSPGTGNVAYLANLKPGRSIRDQSVGPTIAKIDMGMPWWLYLLAALLALCCCFGCLHSVMRKPKPAYKPMPPVETKPEPTPEPVREEAPAPAPPTPPPPPEGLRLDFEDNGQVRTVYAKYRPLGIKHNFVAPIVAHDFTINSYAKMDLGVKDGWKLRRIGDEELNDNPNFEEVNGKIGRYMKDFPLWPLALEFRKTAGSPETHVYKFTERPIGLNFENRAPIQVGQIYDDSPAQRQGVEIGWYLTKIGDFDVHENHNFREVMKYFKEGAQPLDDSGKTYATNAPSNVWDNKK